LYKKQKQQKVVWNGCTVVPLEARAVSTSLVGGLHIFVPNLRIFNPNQLQITFLLLQDEIFQIFVPEIK